jgi:hypothetical protein
MKGNGMKAGNGAFSSINPYKIKIMLHEGGGCGEEETSCSFTRRSIMVTEKEFLVQMQNYQLFQFGLCSMELVQLNSVHAENPYMCYVLFLNTNSEAYFVKL